MAKSTPKKYTITQYARFPFVSTVEEGLGINTKTTMALRPGDQLTYESDFNELNSIVTTKKGVAVIVPKSVLAELA